jgi:choline dehydrogenase-like flavoprotein
VKAGADVYANAWVERIERDGRKCTQVVAKLRDPSTDQFKNVTLTVKAKTTVLSGGAINTPAILLRSQVDPSQRTGKRTYLHPALGGLGIHAEAKDPFVGSPQYVYSDQFVDRAGKMGFLLEGAPLFPMMLGGFNNMLGMERGAFMELLPYMSNCTTASISTTRRKAASSRCAAPATRRSTTRGRRAWWRACKPARARAARSS